MDSKNRYVYEDIDEIPVYNFFKCCEGKLKYMYNDRKGEVCKEVEDSFKLMYDKYCELTVSNKTLKYYRILGEVDYIEKKLNIVPVLVNLLIKTPKERSLEIVKELKNWGFKVNINLPLKTQLESITQRLNNTKTKLNRKNDELKEFNNADREVISLPKQVVKLKTILKGVTIDINKDSISTWVAYWDEVESINNRSNE